MERIIKQTREVGTSAGVLLPRNWLNKQVVVTLFSYSIKDISKDIINILINGGFNEDAKGVYLFGSFARGDHDINSDIDILVITRSARKFVKQGNFEISLIPEDYFSRNLTKNLIYLSMLKEAKVIFNKELIEKYQNKKKKYNFNRLLSEIRSMVKINKENLEFCEEEGQNVLDGIVYSIILRLRELFLIRNILSNEEYNKGEFIKIVGEKNYLAYLRIKREEKVLNNLLPNDVKRLLDLSERWLKELKEQRKALKA